ncbi:MAG: hypothetical protein Q9163_005632 [Psora crenata]
MHYVRFLKSPKFYVDKAQSSVKALVTVSTDLGDDFLPAEVKLQAVLLRRSVTISEWKTFAWKPGMRAIWIEINASPTLLKDTPSLLVNSRRSTEADDIRTSHLVGVLGASACIAGFNEASSIGRVERRLRTTSAEICIYEDMGESIARHIWDAATALIAYIDQVAQMGGIQRDSSSPPTSSALEYLLEASDKSGLRILELGSGCGIVGIWMATAFPNAQVIMTDLPEAMEILGANINQARFAVGTRLGKEILDWEEEVPQSITAGIFNLIMVSDCTYNCDSVPALVQTLASLINRSPGALIIVSMKMRHRSELGFFDLMAEVGLNKLVEASMPLSSVDRVQEGQSHEAAVVYVFRGSSFPRPDDTS